jgi:multidrug efflux pump
VFAGMLVATMIGIFFIPLFFRVIRGLADRRRPEGSAATQGAT